MKNEEKVGNYKLIKTIGEGTFGKVKLAIHIPTDEKVAIKILEKSKITNKEELERVEKEIKYLKMLNHPNIIELYEIIENSDNFYIVMEYISGGELFNYLVEKGHLDELETSFFFSQLIHGIEEIHKHKICHRDLKAENLLITENKTLKIIDFGLSNEYIDTLSSACGSPCYAAPEMIRGKKYYGLGVDLWAAGIILFAMLYGYLPFDDSNNEILFRKILECKIDFPSEDEIHISDNAKNLINRILTPNPIKRIKLNEILEHNFLKYGNKKYDEIIKPQIFVQNDVIINYMVEELKFSNEDDLILKLVEANKHNNYTTTYKLLKKKIIEGRFDYNFSNPKKIYNKLFPYDNMKNHRKTKNKGTLRKSIKENENKKINKTTSLDSTENSAIHDLNNLLREKNCIDNNIFYIKNDILLQNNNNKHKKKNNILQIGKFIPCNFIKKIDTSVSTEKKNITINNNTENSSTSLKKNKKTYKYRKANNEVNENNIQYKKLFYIPSSTRNNLSVENTYKTKKTENAQNYLTNLTNLGLKFIKNKYNIKLSPLPISLDNKKKKEFVSVDKMIIKKYMMKKKKVRRKSFNKIDDQSSNNKKKRILAIKHNNIVNNNNNNITTNTSVINTTWDKYFDNSKIESVNCQKKKTNKCLTNITSKNISPNYYTISKKNNYVRKKIFTHLKNNTNLTENNLVLSNNKKSTSTDKKNNNMKKFINKNINIKLNVKELFPMKFDNFAPAPITDRNRKIITITEKEKSKINLKINNAKYIPLNSRVKQYYPLKTENKMIINTPMNTNIFFCSSSRYSLEEAKMILKSFCKKHKYICFEIGFSKYNIFINKDDSFIFEICSVENSRKNKGNESKSYNSVIKLYHCKGNEKTTKEVMKKVGFDIFN